MKTKHTEGEWMLAKASRFHYQIISDKPHEGIMGSSDDTIICNLAYLNSMTEEEVKANAKLMASSPELLRALIGYQKMYDEIMPTGGYQGVYEIAEMAIKKATE